jgi:hypothetical protein
MEISQELVYWKKWYKQRAELFPMYQLIDTLTKQPWAHLIKSADQSHDQLFLSHHFPPLNSIAIGYDTEKDTYFVIQIRNKEVMCSGDLATVLLGLEQWFERQVV